MDRSLQKLFKEHHSHLLEQWFHQLINAYPPETVKYFERYENTFTNPIGSITHQSLNAILEELEGEADADRLYREMEMILKIKAVQDVQPSKALAFVTAFKAVIEAEFAAEIKKGEISMKTLLDFYQDLDALALLGFNIYVESRELIFKMRIDQIKETNDLLVKANLLNESVDTSTLFRCSNYIEANQEGES